MNIRIIAAACLMAATGLAGCASSGGSSPANSPQSPGSSAPASSTLAAAAGCPVNAATVSAALKTQLVAASTAGYQLPEPALCVFQTPSEPVFTVQITAFPFTTGRYKNKSLASIKDELKAAAATNKSLGLTYQLIEHPEWGTDAFVLLSYYSGKPDGVEVWTTKYSAAIGGSRGNVSASAYLSYATNLGDALVHPSK